VGGGAALGEENGPGLAPGGQVPQEPGGSGLEVQKVNVAAFYASPRLPVGQVEVGHVQAEGLLGAGCGPLPTEGQGHP